MRTRLQSVLMRSIKNSKNTARKPYFTAAFTNPSTRFVNNIIYAAVALAGAFLIPLGTLTVGGLSVLLSYANQYMKPFNDITSVITEMQNALACATRIFDLLEEPEEVNDSSEVLEKVDGNVDIDHVDFSYDKSKSLIENFNLQVEPGMRIAIVGPTGCGKTTFINLLMRFYDVDSGKSVSTVNRSMSFPDIRSERASVWCFRIPGSNPVLSVKISASENGCHG